MNTKIKNKEILKVLLFVLPYIVVEFYKYNINNH